MVGVHRPESAIMSFWIVCLCFLASAHTLDESTLKNIQTRPELPDFHVVLSKLEETHPNTTCCRDFKQYVTSREVEEWAKRMYDSMEKIPFGLYHGRFVYMGSFDECIQATADGFTGKHCLVDIIFGWNEPTLGNSLSYGVCIPSTCAAPDIRSALGNFGINETNVTVEAKERNCWTNDPVVLSTEDWIVIGFFGFVGLVIVSSTIFDVLYGINAKGYDLYSAFSVYRNGQELMETRKDAGNVGCLHGMRCLTLFWVILCHEYLFSLYTPMLNAGDIYKEYVQNKNRIPILNGFVAVDTFFLLSGFLTTLVFFRNVSKTGGYDVPVAVIHRLLRVTPAFATMVLIQSTIIVRTGRGPMWNKVVGTLADVCRDSWWAGLIYLQNILKPNSICLGQSWYLSSDMQMFWMSPVLLYPLLLWPRKGPILLLGCLATSLTTSVMISVLFELGPHFIITKSNKQFVAEYIQTHMRMTPYIVGIGLGYLLCGMKAKKITVNMSKGWLAVGWLLSAGLCLSSTHGLLFFIDVEYWKDFIQSSLYLTFHRLGWSLGVSWVIFACYAGYGGFVNHVLSWNGFQIFGKLSFCMFLTHPAVQLFKHGMMQTNFYIHDVYLVSNYFSTFAFSVLFSLILYLSIEAPITNLDRYFLGKLKILPLPKRGKPRTESSAACKLLSIPHTEK